MNKKALIKAGDKLKLTTGEIVIVEWIGTYQCGLVNLDTGRVTNRLTSALDFSSRIAA